MAISDGGVHAKRGFEFETHSLLVYLLIRMLEGNEDFSVTFEKYQDAMVVYRANSKRDQITELVQCKKRERAPSDKDPSIAIQGWDTWSPGECRKGDLVKWLQSPTGNSPITKLLEAPNYRYTVLLYSTCQNTLQRFVPSGLGPNWRHSDHVTIIRSCPVNFEHAKDPDVKREIGSERVARRVRIIPMASPTLLEAQSRTIVELLGVRPDASHKVLHELLRRVQEKQQSLPEINRQINSSDIRQVLMSGAISPGRWQSGIDVLKNSAAMNGPGLRKSTDFTILAEGRFWKNQYFGQAETVLLEQHAIVITGPITSGKSTICKYLMYRFAKIFPDSKIYHLDVRPGDILLEELSFFTCHLSVPALFVIDNEHYSDEAVASFVRAFRRYDNTNAFLLVTSTHTYSRTQVTRSDHPLHQFPSITIEDFGSESIHDMLDAILPGLDRLSSAQRDFLANAGELSGGKIGLTVVFARCFQDEPNRIPDDRVFNLDQTRRAIRIWLEKLLPIPNDTDFDSRVVPLLMLVSFGIAVPTVYDPTYISTLYNLGVLESLPAVNGARDRFVACDISLPVIVARQYQHRTEEIIYRYLQQHPYDLPAVSSALSNSPVGKAALRSLVISRGFDLAAQLDELFSTNRAGFNIALKAIRQATPDHAQRLLRAIAAPAEQVNRSFAEAIFEFRGAEPIRTAIATLDLFNQLDRQLVRLLFDGIAGRHELNQEADYIVESVVGNLAPPSVGLLDALSMIIAIRRCHFKLGSALFDSFIFSAAYKDKKALLGNQVEQFSEMVKSCRALRTLSHKVFLEYSNEFLQQDRVESTIRRMNSAHTAIEMLRDLRRIHPRIAIDVLWRRWRTRPDWFSQAMRRSPDIVTAIAMLNAISRIDRRVAMDLGLSQKGFLCHLVEQEENHFRLVSAIGVAKALSPKLASEMAQHVDAEWLLGRLNAEKHRIALVGRALSDCAESWPPLASELIGGLDLQGLYGRISPRAFLYNFIFLTRGFLDGMLVEPDAKGNRAEQLIVRLRGNAPLTYRIEQAMKCKTGTTYGRTALREIAVAFALLTDVGLTKYCLFRLYGILNSNDMLGRVRCWLSQDCDIIEIRQFIYAMMMLSDQSFAREALDALPSIVSRRQLSSMRSHRQDRHQRSIPREREYLPQGGEINNIAEIGDLLRLAAAIDEESAAVLVQRFDLDQLAATCARDRNLGRHVALLHGLHAASRSACINVARKVYDESEDGEQGLIDLLEGCESSEQVLQLVRTLQLVAPSIASKILKITVELGRERFIALLGVEANLHVACGWLRTISQYPAVVFSGFQDKIVELMSDIRTYDDRLFSNVEAALALAGVNRASEADLYVGRIKEASRQAASLRSPMTLIELVLRLVRIDQVLNQSCLVVVLEEISPESLEQLISAEDSPVVGCFAYYLLRRFAASSTTKYDQTLDRVAKSLLDRLGSGAVSSSSLIARMLLGEVAEKLIETTHQLEPSDILGFRPWELGLMEIVYSLVYPENEQRLFVDGSPWQQVDTTQREEIMTRRRRYFGEDVSGLKCALSLRSSFDLKYMGLSATLVQRIIKGRGASDSRKAIQLLLDANFPMREFAKYPYYLKVIFDETVFVRYRFDWSTRIVNEVHSRMFVPS